MNQLKLCEKIARELHDGQNRRGGEDYINHPLRVSKMLGNETLKCIALLHDVIEDTNETEWSLVKRGVTQTIADGVDILSKTDNISYEEYIDRLKYYPGLIKVKVADMFDNLCCDPTEKQKERYRDAMNHLFSYLN